MIVCEIMWEGSFSKRVLWFCLRCHRLALTTLIWFLLEKRLEPFKIKRPHKLNSPTVKYMRMRIVHCLVQSHLANVNAYSHKVRHSSLVEGALFQFLLLMFMKTQMFHSTIISRSNAQRKKKKKFSKWYIENTCFAWKAIVFKGNKVGWKASPKVRPAKLHRTSVVHWCIKRLCSFPLSTLAALRSSLRNHQNSNTIRLHSSFCLLGRRHNSFTRTANAPPGPLWITSKATVFQLRGTDIFNRSEILKSTRNDGCISMWMVCGGAQYVLFSIPLEKKDINRVRICTKYFSASLKHLRFFFFPLLP